LLKYAYMSKRTPKLSSLIDKAVFDYNLIEDGDKILIGASGGKDSTALLEYFGNRLKRPNCNFEVAALNIQSDLGFNTNPKNGDVKASSGAGLDATYFSPSFPSKVEELIKGWGIPFEKLNVNVLERVKEGQKMSCWWCSTQRRTELLNYAIAKGYNKIALGHHLDDILETLLMNMLNKGEFSTMIPKLKYDNYPVTIIRPLCYISEDRLIEHAQENGYAGFVCTCNYQEKSDRRLARKKLELLCDGDSLKKMRLFNSLKNVQPQYLP